MKKRALVTIGQLNVGGAELRLLQLVRTIQRMDLPLTITFFVVKGQPGTLDDDFRTAGAEIVYGHLGVRGLLDLWSLCRRLRPDVLHVNAETAAGFYAGSGLLAGVPKRLAHYRSMNAMRGVRAHVKSVAHQVVTNLCCQRFIGVSNGSRRGRLILRPWQTIYNGITPPSDQDLRDMRVPPHYHADRIRIAVLGRIERTKNVDRAVQIFAQFRTRSPAAELHIIGPLLSVPTEEIEAVVRSAGVADAVFIHGPVSSPFQYLAHSSLLLLTSSVEGLPGVVIEALACGTPVVSSDVPGAQEIAARTLGVCCLSLRDSNEQWAAAMADALTYSRVDIRHHFRQSPFHTDRYVAEILKAWDVAI